MLDPAIEEWVRSHVVPADDLQIAHQRSWSLVLRVPLSHGVAWFKACGTVQAFEPRLTAELYNRSPDLVAEVLAWDEQQASLLLADAGQPLSAIGNPPERWLELLPAYAELQRSEASQAREHLAHGVPDQRIASLPTRFEDLLRRKLPLASE